MITWMQKHRKYLVATIWVSTIAFVGAGFVGWGSYDYASMSGSVAKVGDIEVTKDEYSSTYGNIYNYYSKMTGGKLDEQTLKTLNLEKIAVETLVNQALLQNFANELEMRVGDEEVAAKIASMEPFLKNGQFNKEQYLLALKNVGMNPKEFEKGLKELIMQRGRNYMSPYIWHPGKGYNSEVEIDFLTHVNPQCDVINAFRKFFSSVLYKPSGSDRSLNGFNRHLIVHLLKNDFHEPSNFPRIILALTHIMFIESLQNEKVPFFWPGIDQVDMELGSYLRKLTDAIFISRRKLLDSLTTCAY